MRNCLLIIIFAYSVLCSCHSSRQNIEFEPWLEITLNSQDSIIKDACLNCLCISGIFNVEESEYIAFLDFKPGVVYLFNNTNKQFESKFTIPRTPNSSSPHVLKFYNVDSIIYINHSTRQFVFCDSSNIQLASGFPSLYNQLPSPFVVAPIRSRLIEINGNFVFDIVPVHTRITAPIYHDLKNNYPFLGFFSSKDFNLNFQYIPIFDPNPYSTEKDLVNHHNIFEVDSTSQVIYFQNQCMNDLYAFDLKSEQISKINLLNSSFKITPIYFSFDSDNLNDYYEAMNNQNYCFDLCYYSKYKILIRHLSIAQQQERNRYLEIINSDYQVVAEIKLPNDYLTNLKTNDDFILQRYDPKTKTIILEKLNFKY